MFNAADSAQIPVCVIFGCTAVGKTELASALFSGSGSRYPAFKGRAEIISADSMQVYRGLNIGTAKPSPVFLRDLPHHCIDVCDPSVQFTAGDFVRVAEAACADVYARGKTPVIMGGTAFYIKNFVCGLPETPQADEATRLRLKERIKNEGADALWRELNEVDPVSAARIHVRDEYRVARALEVWETSRRPLSSFLLNDTPRSGYKFRLIGIERPRAELYERINARVGRMFEAGLYDEVASLLAAGYTAADPGMRAIGYREFFAGDGFPRREDCAGVASLIKRDTRRYAKRQTSFFAALNGVSWFDGDDIDGVYEAVFSFVFGTRDNRA